MQANLATLYIRTVSCSLSWHLWQLEVQHIY